MPFQLRQVNNLPLAPITWYSQSSIESFVNPKLVDTLNIWFQKNSHGQELKWASKALYQFKMLAVLVTCTLVLFCNVLTGILFKPATDDLSVVQCNINHHRDFLSQSLALALELIIRLCACVFSPVVFGGAVMDGSSLLADCSLIKQTSGLLWNAGQLHAAACCLLHQSQYRQRGCGVFLSFFLCFFFPTMKTAFVVTNSVA